MLQRTKVSIKGIHASKMHSEEIVIQLSADELNGLKLLETNYVLSYQEYKRNKLTEDKNTKEKYQNLLTIIMKMRKFCNEGSLLFLQSEKDETYKVESDVCGICLTPLLETKGLLTSLKCCIGVFCTDCISEAAQQNNKCPYCRVEIDWDNTYTFSPNGDYSSKFMKILDIVKDVKERSEKIVVFSQWTTSIKILKELFEKNQIECEIYQGSQTQGQRAENLERFKRSETCTAIIISLMCGNSGLNIAEANHVVKTDLWWNPSIEKQATSRIDRVTQKKPMYVYEFVCSQTIEECIKTIQMKKMKMIEKKGLVLSDKKIKDQEALMVDSYGDYLMQKYNVESLFSSKKKKGKK
jgi:SNF2 family DNA or RNA helicase